VSILSAMRRDATEPEFTGDPSVNEALLPSRRATPAVAQPAHAYPVTPAQGAYQGYVHPHQVLPEHFTVHMARQPGGQRTLRPFQYLNDIHAWPALGALAFTGSGWGVHGQPWHQVIGGAMIGLGFVGLGFSGIAHLSATANPPHGEDAAQADPHITRGAALLGIGLAAGGTACAAGPTWISFMMLVPELAAGYIGWHQWRHHKALRQRADIISYTAAANPGTVMASVPPVGIPMPVSLPQIVSWEASRLHDAFDDLGISPITIRSIVEAGPDAHTAIITIPSGSSTSFDAILRKKQQLITNLGCRNIELIRGAVGNEIELTWFDGEDHLADTVLWPGPTITDFEEPIQLGPFENLQPVEQSLLWNHTLIAGDTDNGKSNIMNVIICSTLACRNVVRIGIDCKPGAPELGPYRKAMHHLSTSPSEGMRALRGLLAVIKVRGQSIGIDESAIPDTDDEVSVPTRKWDAAFGPYILAAIDELAELTSEHPEAAKYLRRIRQIGRYVGVFCLDATQYPEKEVFGSSTAARKQYQVRIGLHCSQTGTINVILGAGAQGKGWRLDELRHKGSFMIKSREHNHPRAARAYYITDQMIAEMVNRWASEMPELDNLSATAFREAYEEDPESEDGGPAGPGSGGGVRDTQGGDTRGEFRLHVVPTVRYPDGTTVEANWQQLWKEFSSRPNASVDDLVDLRLERLTSRDSVRKALRAWIQRGYAWTDDAGKYYPNPDINRREA